MASLEPEFIKVLNGQKRYEALLGAMGGVGMELDAADVLVKTYDPPKTHSYQVPDAEELESQLKHTVAAIDALRRKVRQFEADLMAKEWDAS